MFSAIRRLVVLAVSVVMLFPFGLVAVANGPEGSVGVVDTTSGIWYLRDYFTGETTSFYYGVPGDYPIIGDWDCDGDETPGLYRQSNGFVYLRNSNSQGVGEIKFFFGIPGDIPIAGDFNNDGCDTVSIYRPGEARIYIINELGSNDGGLGDADFSFLFGVPGDKPFVADFDDDGTDTVGLHRESTGLVYYRNSLTQGVAEKEFIFGDPGDKIIAAEWGQRDGFGPDTVGIFRPSNGTVYLRFSNSQGVADVDFLYGNSNMLPVAGVFGVLPGGGPHPPTPPGSFVDIVINGSGNDVVDLQIPGDVPAVLDITHHGSSNFIVWTLDSSFGLIDLLVNEIGPYDGQRLVNSIFFSPEPLRHLDIDADGSWSITARPISAARSMTTSLTGSGDEIVRYQGSAPTLTSTHDGSSNFIVWGYKSDGQVTGLIVNEIGPYSGTDLIDSGTAIIEVIADGNWTLNAP